MKLDGWERWKRWASVTVRAVLPCVDAKMLADLFHGLVPSDVHVVHLIFLVGEGIIILSRTTSRHTG